MKHITITAILLSALLVAVWASSEDGKAGSSITSLDICRTCCESKGVCPHICPGCPSSRGQCPYVNRAAIRCRGPPRDSCRSDFDCPSDQRCCDSGCSRHCSPLCLPHCGPGQKCLKNTVYCLVPPCPQPPPTCDGPKPGTCPVNDLLPVIFCVANTPDKCSKDVNCPGRHKCCSYGCARTCVPPCLPACRPDQKCVLQRNAPCLGDNCPPQQRLSSCEPINPCSVVDCKPDSRCEVRSGRAICVKINPCSLVRCTSGTRCVVRRGRASCQPRLLRSVRPGTCPVNDVISTCVVRKDACTSDAQCKYGEKCCLRGCGRACVPVCPKPCPSEQKCKITVFPCLVPPCPEGARCVADKPVVRPGICPRNDIITICVIRKDACTSDAQCKYGEKCCSRGCGRVCVPACQPPCAKCSLLVGPVKCKSSPVPCKPSHLIPFCLSVACKGGCPPESKCRRGSKGTATCVKIYRD